MGKMKISCDEATTICDKSQYGEASLLEIIKLKWHFMDCKICARYTQQNGKLTEICKEAKKRQESCGELSDDTKQKMKEQLKNLEL